MNRWSHKTLKFTFTLAALALGLTLVGLACGGGDESGSKTPGGSTDTDGSVSLDLSMGDNFFDLNGERNPTLDIAAGATVEIELTNDGAAIHNMRFAGEDNQYNNGDDAVSDPDQVPARQTAVIEFTAPQKPGAYKYQCDYHPTESKGEITVK